MPSLFPFQKKGVQWLLSHRRAILADEMGLGKTAQASCAILPDSNGNFPSVFIFCPASLTLNWEEEVKRWTGFHLKIFKASDPWQWPRSNEIFLRTYNGLPRSYTPEDHYKPRLWPGMYPVPKNLTVIFDEAHYLKSSKSNRSQSARAIAECAERVWMLTGTPLLNRPQELWALGQALGYASRDIFSSWDAFVAMFRGKKKDKYGGYVWGGATPAALAALDKVMLRRRRTEVMPELPRKTYRDVLLPMGKDIDVPKAKEWDDEKVVRECRLPIGELSTVRAKLAKEKVSFAIEIALSFVEQEEALVIFSAHRVISEVRDKLGAKGIRCGLIQGDVSKDDRDHLVRGFQKKDFQVLCGTIGAMGTGLTLTAACHALFIDLDWVPANNAQAEDRICRIGQTRPVVIHRLISESPIDKRIWKALERKQKLVDSIERTNERL